MLRSFVLLLFLLANGIAAKPLKPRGELANEAVQKGWVSIDDKGMASWGVEVEPPEDMDETSFDIEPGMKIWKRVQIGQSKQYQMAEDDLDDLQHPSTKDLVKAYAENKPDALPAADKQAQDGKNNQKAEEDSDNTGHPLIDPEEDLDEVYHSEKDVYKYLAPLVAGYEGEPVFRAVHSEPEQDEDITYHADVDPGMLVVPLEPEMETKTEGRLYLEPEEDMDDVYHKDIPDMILYNSEAQPAADVDWPLMRKHTEPEEDLDTIYHD